MTGTSFGALVEDAVQILIRTGTVIAPREDAEALAAHVFGPDAVGRPSDGELDGRLAAEYRTLVDRRADGVPLGHLTGVAALGGIEVTVGPGVFVPRAQSEAVLSTGLRAIADLTGPLVVDLCTGSGAVALAIAHHRPDATVHAVECDPVALDFARRNSADRTALGDTAIVLHQADVTRPGMLSGLSGRADLVLANPPFMPDDAEVPAEFGVHQPRQAVFGGPDGLHVIRHVADAAARLLGPGGRLVVEHGHLHAETVPVLLRADDRFEEVSGHLDQYGWPLYSMATRRRAHG
ncbi:HemK/PrmC family methyltransferase [Kitasatospora sp. GP82]|uniref:N5-glutamine methyltransferase family protein n=1 Tax=Kitasatospora sp. GP82 TaxID=3035089 RepID=UPI0024754488|nr:HemK/PrmC family methyltransferase [Kitasatospora sp. GP82]MDH6125661.1 release factor glutamine methyltransferase [Kitasatospora sp. GP82]